MIDYNSCYYSYQRFSRRNEESFFIDPRLHVRTAIGRGSGGIEIYPGIKINDKAETKENRKKYDSYHDAFRQDELIQIDELRKQKPLKRLLKLFELEFLVAQMLQ